MQPSRLIQTRDFLRARRKRDELWLLGHPVTSLKFFALSKQVFDGRRGLGGRASRRAFMHRLELTGFIAHGWTRIGVGDASNQHHQLVLRGAARGAAS